MYILHDFIHFSEEYFLKKPGFLLNILPKLLKNLFSISLNPLELSHLSKSESFDNNYAKFMYIGMILMLKILLSGNAEERKVLEKALLLSLNEYNYRCRFI
jgi:hypothetical protein